MIPLIILYLILGIFYLYLKYRLNNIPDLWSPMQPISFIVLWPIVLIADLIRRINREIKNLKSS